jgi:hypothetical protein
MAVVAPTLSERSRLLDRACSIASLSSPSKNHTLCETSAFGRIRAVTSRLIRIDELAKTRDMVTAVNVDLGRNLYLSIGIDLSL